MITKDSYEGELKKFRKCCRKHPNELGCYVYALADPTKGKEQVFYVGKGQKKRMFNHIKISGTESSDADILERVRKSWRINPERANKATYIAACRNGVIIGLYTNSSGWLPVQLIESQNDEGRFYFEGVSVTDKSVLERYINRIVEIPKGARYPILYVGGWK